MRAAVLGSPIAHSLSPVLHRAAYEALGLDWTYEAIEMTPDRLGDFLRSCDDSWVGLSLTMPLKVTALELADEVDRLARTVRSANTLVHREGRWIARNTDVFGIIAALREAGVTDLRSARILGAGATGRSAMVALKSLGCTSVTVSARRVEAAEELCSLARLLGLEATATDLQPRHVTEDLLISVLPSDAAAPWAPHLSAVRALLDASYHPWPSALATALASAAPSAGVASGRDMLLWQAVEQVQQMTGQVAPVEAMRNALEAVDG